MKSLGLVEVSGVVAAVDALDIMCKSSNVSFVTWERKLGGRLVTMIVEGSISDVTEAVENVKAKCVSEVRASNVIARPHSETVRMVELSASRINQKKKSEISAESAPVTVAADKAVTSKVSPKAGKRTSIKKK